MYVGDDHGYIISVEGYAENIRSVMGDSLPGSRANVSGLSARPRKTGTLFVTDQTRITTLLEECHYDEGQAFPYHTTEITNDFATWEHAQGVVGAYIALVLKVSNVELKYTEKGDSYVEIHGVDMDAAAVGPLRLWRHDEDDIDHGEIYILRGMKVVYGSKWSYEQNKYVQDTSVPMQLECNARTAIERVTHAEAIQLYFRAG